MAGGLGFRLGSGMHEGVGGSDDEGAGEGSSGDEDLDPEYDPVYGLGIACTNCTGMLYGDIVCPVRALQAVLLQRK